MFRFFSLIVASAFFWEERGTAQTSSRWRIYKAADGLDDSLCTTVTVGQRSNIWVSHFQNGFTTGFDGYEMRKIPAPGMGPFRIHETAEGQLWAVSPEGLQELQDQKWMQYPIPEIRALGASNSLAQLRQISLAPLQNGQLLICLTNGLLQFIKESPPKTVLFQSSEQTGLERFADAIPSKTSGAWIAGARGLARVRVRAPEEGGTLSWEEVVPPPELGVENFQHLIEDAQGGVAMVAESSADQRRVIVTFNEGKWTVYRPKERPRLGWRDSDGIIWAMTANSLFWFDELKKEFVEEQEIAVTQFLDAAIDRRGLIWVATSDGLFCRVPLPWHTPLSLKAINGRVHAMDEDDEHRLWLASNVGLHCYDGQTLKTFPYPEGSEGFLQPGDALWFLQNEFFMNADGRLLRFSVQTHSFKVFPHPSGARIKILGWLEEGALCTQVLQSAPFRNQLQSFDGKRFSSTVDLPATETNGAELTSFLVAQNDAWWIGGVSGVAVFQNETWKRFLPGEGLVPDGSLSLVETSEGKIWSGGSDRLWEYDGKKWTGIRSGFDRVNKILRGSGNTYWVASNNGLRGLNKGEWLVNSVQEGLPNAAVITVFEDHQKNLWVGTAHGVSLYIATNDIDPPHATIEIIDYDKKSSPRDTVTLAFKAEDRWKITDTERLLYSYRLDEQEWSPWRPNDFITFSELASGKHVFQLRAIDRNWNITSEPIISDFTITLPWYQETRLILIALAGCGVALFFAILAYNRHRKLVRSYAEIEKIVTLRTQQLEKANLELLHSQKMTALGTLSAGIAHDFNNILSIIKGSAQIIETNLGDPEKILTRLNRIKTVVEQGSGIVKAMLGFSRGTEKKPAPCDLNEIAEETIKLLGDRFLREVDVKFERNGALPAVPASKEFVQQILLNFIFNAADALNGSGKVVLRTGRLTQLTDYIALKPATAPEYLFIAVEDFGTGIAPETMSRIFEPFFTTKAFSARRGTGLGLSMVYELAKEMGSGLVVKSEPGKGSVFTLVLPLLPQRENRFSE